MKACLNPQAILWAINRCGETVESLSKRWPKLTAWIEQTHTPTLRQLEEFAKCVHVGLDLLFEHDAPHLALQIADFRTIGTLCDEPSPELYDTVAQMKYRQDWLRDYFSELGCDEIDFVGLFSSYKGMSASAVSETIRSFFELSETWAFAERDVSSALKTLRDKIEDRRISVVINGVVGDNAHRPLDVAEFRGFVLADRLAPLVFVNGRDAKSAQVFTLIHEITHLVFAQTGVVSPYEEDGHDDGLERFCDAVAAEVLVSQDVLIGMWEQDGDAFDNIERARRKFKVSFVVCARKALELGLVSESEFSAAMGRHNAAVEGVRAPSGSGGNYYLTKAYRVGRVFGDAVFTATQARRITYSEAFRLTGLSAKTFDKYFKGYAA